MHAELHGRPVIYGPDGTMWLECKVVSPQSAKGRSVDIFLDRDKALWLFKEMRTALIEDRAKPEGS